MKNFGKIINLLLITTCSAVFISSCGSSRTLNVERGSGYNFKAGFPEFQSSAFGFVDDQQGPTLSLTVDLIKGSLIYKKKGDSLSANYAVTYQVKNADNDKVLISKTFQRNITTTNTNITDSRDAVRLNFSLHPDPAHYKILVNVKDLNTDKDLSQNTTAYIPATQKGAYALSKVQMYGKINGTKKWAPVNTYDVKGRVDSLRFVVQLISGNSDNEMTINSKLVKFRADTGYARPMHYPNYSQSNIAYDGIDYDEKKEIRSNQRILKNYNSVFIEYKFANQHRGNYRFEVRAQKSGQEKQLFKGRAFGVKSRDYPAIKTPRELAGPLIYLMGEKDHDKLMQISNPDSLKKQIDRFWLKNIGNAEKARRVINKYYQRVEEANKQFSSYKEGWKTDMGMIYILFGPPWYTEHYVKQMDWYYNYNRGDPEYSYLFYQPKTNNKYYPFYHYILQRSNNYYTVQYQQRQLWLTGLILKRDI